MTLLTGINTGIIKSPKGVLAIVVKATTSSTAEQLLYLPPDRVQELMFALCGGYRALQRLHQACPETITAQVQKETLAMSASVPSVTPDEVHNPILALRVTDLVMKLRENNVTLLFFLQDSSVVTLELALTQMEFMLNVFVTTIQNTQDALFIAMCSGANDFVPLYTVDFTQEKGKGINYNQFTIPDWKSRICPWLYSVIALQRDGAIPCGIIIKTGQALDPGRAEAIGQLLLRSNGLLMPFEESVSAFDCMRLDLQAGEESTETLLRAHLKHRVMKLN